MAPAVRLAPQQKSQENQEDLAVREVPEGLEDLQQSLLQNQGALGNQEVLEAPADPVVREVQEDQVDLEVQRVPRLRHQGQVYRQKSQPQGNQEPQGDQEALKVLVDPVDREVQVCYTK